MLQSIASLTFNLVAPRLTKLLEVAHKLILEIFYPSRLFYVAQTSALLLLYFFHRLL